MDQYVLSLSYGKDSLACLGAIEKLGWPLDRIVTAEVWATDDIPADLPPMVEFKSKADAWIKDRYGIEVEHIFATRERERERDNPAEPSREKLTYEKIFYRERQLRGGQKSLRIPCHQGTMVYELPQERCDQTIMGYATRWSQYCTGELKRDVLRRFMDSRYQSTGGTGAQPSSPGVFW